jgi:hypothetical protein
MTMRLASISAVLLLAACAPSSHIITGKTRPPIDAAQVKIYSSPPAQFEEIAIVEASSRGAFAFGDQANTDVMLGRLKEEAAKLGANGLLMSGAGSEGGGGVGTGVGFGGRTSVGVGIGVPITNKAGQARAIYVTKE